MRNDPNNNDNDSKQSDCCFFRLTKNDNKNDDNDLNGDDIKLDCLNKIEFAELSTFLNWLRRQIKL